MLQSSEKDVMVLKGFGRFYGGSIRFHKVPSGSVRLHIFYKRFYEVLCYSARIHKVPNGSLRFYTVSLGPQRFYRVPKEFLRVPTGSICMGFYWVPQGSIRLHKAP